MCYLLQRTCSLVIFLLCLLNNLNVNAQTLPYTELNEIIELYSDGQYDVVKAKLGNIGFVVTKSTPDYTLNGVVHSGDFVMMREKSSSVEAYRQHGFTDTDRFFFSTVSKPSEWPGYAYDRDSDINFDFAEVGATGVYNNYRYFWKNAADTTYSQCSQDRKYVRFARREQKKIHNPIQDKGPQAALVSTNLYLEMSDKPVEVAGFAPTPREFINGLFTRKVMYLLPVVPSNRRVVSKKK